MRRYLVLGVVTLASAFGDTALAVGMKRLGPVPLTHPDALLTALQTPWVLSGILLLLVWTGCYLTALSWADLTFVLPATSLAYVAVALLSRFWLHEQFACALAGYSPDYRRSRFRNSGTGLHAARID